VIEGVVGRDDDHMGTELERLRNGHRRFDPVSSRFIARRGDDTPYLLSAVDMVDKVIFEALFLVTVEDWSDKRAAVVVHQSDIGTFFVEDFEVAATAYRHRDTLEGRVDGTLGGGEEAVYVDVEEHTGPISRHKFPLFGYTKRYRRPKNFGKSPINLSACLHTLNGTCLLFLVHIFIAIRKSNSHGISIDLSSGRGPVVA